MILEKTRLFFGLFYTFAKNLRIINMDKLIGREKEIKQLNDYVTSDRPEFIAIYGRRRVGKTFLVNQLFGGKMAFSMTGVMQGSLASTRNNLRAGKRHPFFYIYCNYHYGRPVQIGMNTAKTN